MKFQLKNPIEEVDIPLTYYILNLYISMSDAIVTIFRDALMVQF